MSTWPTHTVTLPKCSTYCNCEPCPWMVLLWKADQRHLSDCCRESDRAGGFSQHWRKSQSCLREQKTCLRETKSKLGTGQARRQNRLERSFQSQGFTPVSAIFPNHSFLCQELGRTCRTTWRSTFSKRAHSPSPSTLPRSLCGRSASAWSGSGATQVGPASRGTWWLQSVGIMVFFLKSQDRPQVARYKAR